MPNVIEMCSFALAAYISKCFLLIVITIKDSFISFQGITRITDNRHHVTDVLSGAILGTAIAIMTVRKLSSTFS